MKIKEGVIMPDQIEMRTVLKAADRIWRDLDQELVITSGKEGAHSAGSYHYYGLAVDLRIRYFTEREKFQAYHQLVKALEKYQNPDYTVVLHKTHIHVQANK